MDLESNARKELIDSLLNVMVTPNVKLSSHNETDDNKYASFIKAVNLGRDSSVQLSLDYALKNEMFNLVKDYKVFIESSVKFITTFTTKRPIVTEKANFSTKYIGNEFDYAFLDNHPGIINVDKLKDIPTDYEGLMAVPPTVLEYKNLVRFNVHRILYTPKFNGKFIYPRIVASNKFIVTD
jgi:hypothetical protein